MRIGANGAAWEIDDLAVLAQLEQREECDRLLDARETLHLCVEVEPAAAQQDGTEALHELGHRRKAQRQVRE